MRWEDFLRKIADEYGLTRAESETFIKRFGEDYRGYTESDFYKVLAPTDTEASYKKRLTSIYKRFTPTKSRNTGCVALANLKCEKLPVLRQWLEEQYKLKSSLNISNIPPKENLANDLQLDWGYICEQMLLLNFSQAIQKLELYKIPEISTKITAHPLNCQDNTIEYEDRAFFEAILNSDTPRNIAVLCRSSVAKSLLLKKFGSYLVRSKKGFPVYIASSEMSQQSLLNYLLQNFLETALAYIPDLVEVSPELKTRFIELFQTKKVWLLIDVDKFTQQPKQALISILNHHATGFLQEANLILTCKPKVWQNCQICSDDSRFDVYDVLPLDESRIKEYIELRFNKNPQLGEALQEQLKKLNDSRINTLVQNPSYLVRLCENWATKNRKNEDFMGDFYEEFQNTYLYWKFLILGS